MPLNPNHPSIHPSSNDLHRITRILELIPEIVVRCGEGNCAHLPPPPLRH